MYKKRIVTAVMLICVLFVSTLTARVVDPVIPKVKDMIVRKTQPEAKFNDFLIRNTVLKTSLKEMTDKNGTKALIDVKINDVDSATMTQGDDFYYTIEFSTGYDTAEIVFWVDADGDGVFNSENDMPIDESEFVTDNDVNDEDPTAGIYKSTMAASNDGPNNVSNITFFVAASDDGGFDAASLHVDPMNTAYSVSGTVTPNTQNIIISVGLPGQEGGMMAATDSFGNYTVFVESVDDYYVGAYDFLGQFGGMFSDTLYTNVHIDGHLTGYDFEFLAPDSWIVGKVSDDTGSAVEGATIYVRMKDTDGMSLEAVTDTEGDYTIGVVEGTWEGQIARNLPGYMYPDSFEFYVNEGDTVTNDITVNITDATISGTVYFDGNPAPNIRLTAYNGNLNNETETDSNGDYSIDVCSSQDAYGGYWMYVDTWDLPDGVIVQDNHDKVLSGSTGIDFNLITVAGAVTGSVYNSETAAVLYDAEISTGDGTNWYNDGTWEGSFYLALPNGTYDLEVRCEGFYNSYDTGVVINDNVLNRDYNLVPIVYAGSITGHVYDNDSSLPIAGADIQLWGENINMWDETDGTGYFYFDLPNGTFSIGINYNGYQYYHTGDFTISDNNLDESYYMISTGIEHDNVPQNTELMQNYPNPFNPVTQICFTLQKDSEVELGVYNINGQKVSELVSGKVNAGYHSVDFNASDLNSGVYYYKLETENTSFTKKMVLIK